MKITILILTLFLVQVSAATKAQITLKEDRITIQKAIESISVQSGYDFIYSTADFKNLNPIRIHLTNATIETALSTCFKGQSLVYEITDKTVIIKKKQVQFPIPSPLPVNVDEINVKGIILDDRGQPLSGVNVIIKGTSKSMSTDADGRFSIRAEIGGTLVISCVGYKKHEIQVQTREIILQLVQDIVNLDQIQIIAYGTSSKRLNTATVSSVSAEVLATQPVNNVLTALNGRVPGVQLVQSSGMAGSGVAIKIRGDNSGGFYGSSSSDPLYVIDGIPQASGSRYDFQNINSNVRGMNGYTNIFNTLNMEDIEQIDILKDADATAIYGARGANGVVVITTKKGKQGKIKVNVNLTAGAGKVGHFIPMLNTQQYLDLRKEAFKNEGITPDAANAPDLLSWDQNAYTDYQRLLLGGTAATRTANINASGGSEFINYYVGLNYRKEGTVIADNQHVNRIGGLMNLNITSPNRKFNALFSANYAQEKSNLTAEDFMSLIYLPPNFNLYKTDGSLNWNNNFDNPLAYLRSTYHATNTLFSANTTLSYKLVSGLTLKTTAGYTISRLENDLQLPTARYNPVSARTSWAWFAKSPTSNYIVEPQAEYIIKVGPGKLTALVGGTFSESLSESTTLKGDNYTYDTQLNSITGAGLVTTVYQYNQYHYASLFSRLNYDISNKYLLNLTYRNDASSRFGPNNRLASFGSAGAAWLFSEEELIKEKLPFLSFGKLKASYGTTGNDRISNYLYTLNYSTGGAYQNISTLLPSSLAANPNLKWESTKKAELNLSLGFLKDRILFNGNIYRNRSSNLLNYTALPGQTGTSTIISNLDAVVQNQGLELELNTKNLEGRNFNWSSSFNISFERNKLISFNDIAKATLGSAFVIGESLDAFIYRNKFKYDGVNPVNGLPIYNDLDGQPGMGTKDMYIAKLGHPFYGGLNNSFSYKGLTLDVFFKFESRNGPTNLIPNDIAPGGLMNQNTSVLNRWRQDGDSDTRWPLAVTGSGAESISYAYLPYSDFTYGNISYLKLKTASLSYNLPQSWIQKAKLQSVKISLQGLNLFTIAKDKYVLDPEYGFGAYPGLRTLVLGINCSL
ncbi:SusC/RagA family TonB-linked outer membrane protein [Solitalea lacus]|uniref:SusC/RagA family TonB-linked outer membrane protein n=1 Tax=Solitalea lacus TaxID=2911172 RepID=UPI001EDB2F11|nr:SusC/RagA family TonB-linked outer membrane protein [Solitalea lacus]UKJ06962.1 SusC/RagA family TonB-linked outer membrane protein [Solitalea lacus]